MNLSLLLFFVVYLMLLWWLYDSFSFNIFLVLLSVLGIRNAIGIIAVMVWSVCDLFVCLCIFLAFISYLVFYFHSFEEFCMLFNFLANAIFLEHFWCECQMSVYIKNIKYINIQTDVYLISILFAFKRNQTRKKERTMNIGRRTVKHVSSTKSALRNSVHQLRMDQTP